MVCWKFKFYENVFLGSLFFFIKYAYNFWLKIYFQVNEHLSEKNSSYNSLTYLQR